MLVDTSVWVEHLRRGTSLLQPLLERGRVRCHPFVIGELACGRLDSRAEVLRLLAALPQVALAEHREVLQLIEGERLAGKGLGWVDAHLLASARLAGTALWTLDRPLHAVARTLGVEYAP